MPQDRATVVATTLIAIVTDRMREVTRLRKGAHPNGVLDRRVIEFVVGLTALLMDRLHEPAVRDEIATVLREEFEAISRQVGNELRSD
jgi:hypothetical protein